MSSTLSSTTVPSSTTTASSTITASSSETVTASSTMSHVKDEDKYLVAIDIGTTTIRCQVLNSNALTVGSYRNKVKLHYPQTGHVEIEPDDLFETVLDVIKEAIKDANLTPSSIHALGFSTQRGTFITWKKDTGEPFHNFITWKDMRADDLTSEWNKSFTMNSFRSGCYLLYLLTRSKRYLAGSSLKLTASMATMRLYWVLQNVPELRREINNNNAMFGTLETWLIYKLTDGKTYVTDATNASATGFFDPYVHEWSSWAVNLFKFPKHIFPQVVNNDYDFGSISERYFGYPIRIECVISDQSASMFGSCCFKRDDFKVTLGTGSFLNLNTNQSVHGGVRGIYPVIAWKLLNEIVYMTEASCNDTGSLIEWCIKVGLASSAEETSKIAIECDGNDGVYFVPAFSGLGAPINDDHAASGFFGVKPTTKKSHMLRAILESIVFRLVLAFNVLKSETDSKCHKICVDGGVSRNDFICQLLADLTGILVERTKNPDIGILGIAFVTGLSSGIWKSKEELLNLREIDVTFQPIDDFKKHLDYRREMTQWLNVVERFKKWYKD